MCNEPYYADYPPQLDVSGELIRICYSDIYEGSLTQTLHVSAKEPTKCFRQQSFMLFIYFSAGNGGSAINPAQLIALTVGKHFS